MTSFSAVRPLPYLLSLILLTTMVLGSCSEDAVSPITDYPVDLVASNTSQIQRPKIYVPLNDGWLEISSSKSRLWNDSAFLVIGNLDSVEMEFRLLSDREWQFVSEPSKTYSYQVSGSRYTFRTDDPMKTWYAEMRDSVLEFYMAFFIYVPGDRVRHAPYHPDSTLLETEWGEVEADTLAFKTYRLHYEPREVFEARELERKRKEEEEANQD